MTESSYRTVKTLILAGLSLGAGFIGWHVYAMVLMAERAGHQLLDCTTTVDGKSKGNPACLQSQLLAITGSTRATMGALAKAAPVIATAVTAASVNSVEASQATTETARSAKQLLDTASGSVGEIGKTVSELRTDMDALTQSAKKVLGTADAAVAGAGQVTGKLAMLADTIDQQVKEQSPEIGKSLQALQALLQDAELKDLLKHIDGAAANAERGTDSGANILETFDIATRDLRKKAGQVKWLIEKILGMIKVTIPAF